MSAARRTILRCLWAIVMLPQTAGPARAQCLFDELAEIRHDTSPPLCSLTAAAGGALQDEEPESLPVGQTAAGADPVLQTSATAPLNVVVERSFEGLGAGFSGPQGSYTPPGAAVDPNGAVGTFQYMQWVNSAVAVFDKTSGAPTCGPIFDPWKGFGSPCEGTAGDGIVQFDKLASRWIIMVPIWHQPFAMCFAISTTADATGTYYRYAFPMPSVADYPKLGVWADGYYVSANMFADSGAPLGGRACAFQRSAMLTGGTAKSQCFQGPDDRFLPADLDGTTPPPAGAPNYFFNASPDALNLWRVHIDWANHCNSSGFLAGGGGQVEIRVAHFPSFACDGGDPCIPQTGTTTVLQAWGDRLMYRLGYRNFGDHESLLVTQSVGSPSGVRWYELRNLNLNPPTVYQQGTFAPGASDRWMGSIAMDHSGGIALGYSVSSSSLHPTIRYTGRANSDLPIGILRAEATLFDGPGSRISSTGEGRWGDYSSMSVDPINDCTFWYTNHYMRSNGNFDWGTRIGAFHFPECANPIQTADAQVVQDTYVSSIAPATNYGVATTLEAGRSMQTAKGGGPLLFRALLHFDLREWLPSPSVAMRSAVLWVYAQSGSGTPTLSVQRLAGAFSEGSATWNNQPATTAVPTTLVASLSSTAGWKAIDVTPLAVDCQVNRGGQCYWRLAEVNETDNTFSSLLALRSKEFSTTSVPYLRIGYQ